MSKRFIAVFAVWATLLGLAAATPTPALAAYTDCPTTGSKLFCIWGSQNASTATGRADYASTGSSTGAVSCVDFASVVPNMNQGGSSYKNNFGSFYVDIYSGLGCTGTHIEIAPGTQGNFDAAHDNWGRSYHLGMNFFYAGVYQFPTNLAYDGMRMTVGTNNPFRDTTTAHTLAEMAVQGPDNNDRAEFGWTKDPGVCASPSDPTQACLFAFKAISGVGGTYANFSDGFTDVNLGGPNIGDAVVTGKTADFRIVHACTGTPTCTNAWWFWADLDTSDATPGNFVGYYLEDIWVSAGSTDFQTADLVQWFGEVASYKRDGVCTNMGSGSTPPSTSSAKMENLGLRAVGAGAGTFVNGDPILSVDPEPTWYNATAITTSPITSIRYGGDGAFCKMRTSSTKPTEITKGIGPVRGNGKATLTVRIPAPDRQVKVPVLPAPAALK